MNTQVRDDLEKRREAIRQEISTLDEAIIGITSPAVNNVGSKGELYKLQSARDTRKRELSDVEAKLSRHWSRLRAKNFRGEST